MTAAANASLASVRLGGRTYPVKTVPTCRTCSSPKRRLIEEALVRGEAPGTIAQTLPDAGVTATNISNHFKRGHLPLVEAAADFAEDDARQRGEALEPVATAMAGDLTFARAVLGRALARVVSGAEEPSIRDGLAAEALLAKFDRRDGDTDYRHAFMAAMSVAGNILDAESFERFTTALSRHPSVAPAPSR